jgi:phosphoribosylformimino-5-aminoimidazole carboxamide ribotide isomerase
MYLLPAIDILDGKVVRLAKGDYSQVTTYHADPARQAQDFEEAGATYVHVVDLDGAKSGKPENAAAIERIMVKTLLKVEVGGGIRSLDQIEAYLSAGASRIVLGTSLIKDPDFIALALAQYKKFLVAGIDARNGEVSVEGWRKGAGIKAEELIAQVSELGFKHLVYTDIARDGMQTGIDVDTYLKVAEIFGNPVIASGGVSSLEDIEKLARAPFSIEGVIAGRALYTGALKISEALDLLHKATQEAQAAKVIQNPCGAMPC